MGLKRSWSDGQRPHWCAGRPTTRLITPHIPAIVERQERLLMLLGELTAGADPVVLGQLAKPALFLFQRDVVHRRQRFCLRARETPFSTVW